MNRKLFCLFILLILATAVLPVSAQNENALRIVGSWMLDRVYENESDSGPVELDPENAAAVYAEKNNIYTFAGENHTALVTINEAGESITDEYTWKEYGDKYTITDPYRTMMEVFYDEENDELHRYWVETAADAMYHNLDFVYTRVPVSEWSLQAVYSNEEGKEPVLLDPENAASLYAEKGNVYTINHDGSASVTMSSDAGPVQIEDENGRWMKTGDGYSFLVEGFEMELVYDAKENLLHRYFTDTTEGAMYPALDFVYAPLKF